jgi:hypothetical protein
MVREARRFVPGFGEGRAVSARQIDRLLRAHSMRVLRSDLADLPAVAWPEIRGVVKVFIDLGVGPAVARYVKLHELGHRIAGDVSEPTIFRFTGPLPEAEPVADIFALLGLLDEADTDQGPEWTERRIRDLVPLDDRGWQQHRVPWLAPEVCRTREMLRAG